MEYKEIASFTTINRYVSPLLHNDGELLDIQNLHTDKLGSLIKTGDYTIKNAQITASMDIYGGVDYIGTDGGHIHLIAINGSSYAKIYTDTALTTATSSPSVSPSVSPSASPSVSPSVSPSTSS